MVDAAHLPTQRNEIIDLAKGVLILLVIVGHILPGTLEESLTRYTIYAFHMPVFIAVGGYLFSTSKMKGYSVLDFLRYYLKRLILPWGVAVCVYFALRTVLNHNAVGIGSAITEFILPYYHLWYVPAFLVYAFIGYLLVHFGNQKVLIASTAIFTLISVLLCFVDLQAIERTSIMNKILYVVGYTIRPQFAVFFLLGMLCRQYAQNKILRAHTRLGILLVLIIGIAATFFLQNSSIQSILKWIASLFICLITVSFFKTNVAIASKVGRLFIHMGKNSYPLYLWHVIGKILGTPFLNRNMLALYYVVSIVWTIALILVIRFRKNKILIDITGR